MKRPKHLVVFSKSSAIAGNVKGCAVKVSTEIDFAVARTAIWINADPSLLLPPIWNARRIR